MDQAPWGLWFDEPNGTRKWLQTVARQAQSSPKEHWGTQADQRSEVKSHSRRERKEGLTSRPSCGPKIGRKASWEEASSKIQTHQSNQLASAHERLRASVSVDGAHWQTEGVVRQDHESVTEGGGIERWNDRSQECNN